MSKNPEYDALIELMDRETSAKALAEAGIDRATRKRGEREYRVLRATLAGIFEEMPWGQFRDFAEYRSAVLA